MRLVRYGDIDLFRPRAEAELKMRQSVETHLRNRYAPRVYLGAEAVNEIIHYMYDFYAREFAQAVVAVNSLHLLEFTLHEYQQTIAIENQLKCGTLNDTERQDWERTGATRRRALKFIAEEIVLGAPEAPSVEDDRVLNATEILWIAAEEMVNMAMQSDYVFAVFPDKVRLIVGPAGSEPYWILESANYAQDLMERVGLERANRSRFIPQPDFVFDSTRHNDFIGESVRRAVGVDYVKVLQILLLVIDNSVGNGTGFDLPFLNVAELTRRVSEAESVPKEAVGNVIKGFTVAKLALEADRPAIWAPKHEQRAFRRGFFECQHSTGPHIMFSKAMAKESLAILMKSIVFGQLPENWRGVDCREALSRLSNAAGKWFEGAVEEDLGKLRIVGVTGASNGLGVGTGRIAIPGDVGELDFIGFSALDSMLLVIECKMSRDSTEPRLFRDDTSDFMRSKANYRDKFLKKIRWVSENAGAVVEALKSVPGVQIDVVPSRIGAALLTYVPSIASSLIAEFPCISVTEFMVAYESAGRYPFSSGVWKIDI